MSQNLKIGMILPAVPGYSETFIWSKIEGLLKYGNSISLFVSKDYQLGNVNIKVPVYSQPDIRKRFILFIILFLLIIKYPFRVIKFIKQERLAKVNWVLIFKHLIINSHILNKNLDWIHFEFATMGIGRENIAKAMGIQSAVSFRGFDIGLFPFQHPNCYNLLWKTIDKVHTISDDLYQQALNLGLNPKTPFEKITPAIDTDFFFTSEKTGLHDPLRILTIGRLTWKKGFEYSLKSLELLKNAGIRFEYRIVGEGEYREAIMYALHQLNLIENVSLSGNISRKMVKQEFEWADIYIQPSIQEGFCNAVLEAQAMGLLCIVTNAEGLSENVLDGKTGWVVEKRNPIAIKEQILNIIMSDKKDLKETRKNAIDRVKNRFKLEIQNELFYNFYSNL